VSQPAPGRRSSDRRTRINSTTLLAIALPAVCALALVLVRPGEAEDPARPPTRTELSAATVVCPTPMPGTADVALTSAAEAVRGPVTVGLGNDTTTGELTSGRVTTVAGGDGPVAATGQDDTAVGLTAARFGDQGSAAAGCAAPAPVAWFTGVGAGAGHTSVLELVNPDSGTAIAAVTVYGHSGVVDAPELRGVSVPGGSSVRLDLGSELPRRDELALQVVASRGRIGATVLDRYDRVGSGRLTQDWLPAQAEPASSNLLMGLAGGVGRRVLVLANGSDDEVRADLEVVSDDAVFAPKDMPELRIAPQSVARVAVSTVLGPAVKDGASGVRVTSSAPITATVRSLVDGDLSHAVPSDLVDHSSTVLLPEGTDADKSLVVAGAERAGTVTVVSRAASGRRLDRTRAEIAPDRGLTVALPAGAALVTVTPARTAITGGVLVRGRAGAAVVPLTQPATSGLIPAVRPGLP
jgi:hypothetical protein